MNRCNIHSNKKSLCEVHKIDYIMQYINLISEKQNLILSKIDNLESIVKQTNRNNEEIKELVDMIDDRTQNIEHHIEHHDEQDFNIKDDESNKSNSDSDNDNYNNSEKKQKNKKNFPAGMILIPNRSNQKPENISIKIEKNQNSENFNPIEMFLDQLRMSNKKKKEEILSDSDSEYDNTVSVYDEKEKEKEIFNDENFVELTCKIENINDLILLGNKYKDQIDKIKKDDKDKDKNNKDAFYELDGKKYAINLETVCKLSGHYINYQI